MRLFEIDEASIYAKDDEKFRPFIELGQKILNSTEIGSGVDWKGKDDLWNKASIVGGALTRLGNGTGSPQEALEKAGIKSQAEWQEIMSLADQAEKADFDAGDDEGAEDEL